MKWTSSSLNWIYIYTATAIIVTSKSIDASTVEDGESDCAVDAAPACFYPITKLLNCTSSGIFETPSCGLDLLLVPQTLDSFCILADEALNGCLVDLLGTSCSASDPKHSHLQDWLKPLNIVLRKLCTPESMLIMADSFGCEGESIFKCLFSTAATVDERNLVQLLTTQIPQEVCANIEFRGQICLATASFPMQCKSLLRLLKELTQDFVDNTECNVEPLILVPIKEKGKPTMPPTVAVAEESDRTCEVDPIVISACFEPMIIDWKCYFSMGANGCNFTLGGLCSSAQEAIESCAMNLLGYGCEETQGHRFYNAWLESLRTVHLELCPNNGITLKEEQNTYFQGKVPCWIEFFNCFHNLQNQKQFIMLMTEKLTSSVCRELADNVDYCLMTLGFFGQPEDCDAVLDKIQIIKIKFVISPTCDNDTLTGGNVGVIGSGGFSSTHGIGHIITSLTLFIFMNTARTIYYHE